MRGADESGGGWRVGKAEARTQSSAAAAWAYADQGVASAARANEAEFDDRMHAKKTDDQQRNLNFSQRYGTPPTSEANPRERERERD